ncbi:Uncharacterised protein [Vibrio cholerae]|nr:Uncharacterised protein [Vibrio cholerae]CSI34101.1 Uncharacterised protein [Vibrio cholerae]
MRRTSVISQSNKDSLISKPCRSSRPISSSELMSKHCSTLSPILNTRMPVQDAEKRLISVF